MVGDAIQQCRGHFGIAENLHPFGERQIRGDDLRGLFIKLADQVEQQRAVGSAERQIAVRAPAALSLIGWCATV